MSRTNPCVNTLMVDEPPIFKHDTKANSVFCTAQPGQNVDYLA